MLSACLKIGAIIAIVLLGSFLIFTLLYPVSIQIADEKAYFEQAYALSQGKIYTEFELLKIDSGYEPKHYPIGTATLGALFIIIGGKNAIFLLGLSCWISSFFLLRQTLVLLGYQPLAAWLILFFLPAMVLSRHIMSELPSLFVISLFFYLLFGHRGSIAIGFIIGFMAALVIQFREANILLTLPLFFTWFTQHIQNWRLVSLGLVGLLLGFFSRLAINLYFYDELFYIKDPRVSFSFFHLFDNLPFYSLGTLVLIPGGLWFLLRYKGYYHYAIWLAIGAYLFIHLCYGYRGLEAGFLKSLVLGLRFLIPTLPFFVLACAFYCKQWSKAALRKMERLLLLLWGPLYLAISWVDYEAGLLQLHKRSELLDKEINICLDPIYYEYCCRFYE